MRNAVIGCVHVCSMPLGNTGIDIMPNFVTQQGTWGHTGSFFGEAAAGVGLQLSHEDSRQRSGYVTPAY